MQHPLKIIKIPSPNFDKGREGFAIDMIVLHYTALGNTKEVIDLFLSPDSRVSCHYLITRGGIVYQFVDDEDTAWHTGIPERENLSSEENFLRVIRRNIIKPNQRSIGIELENWGPLLKKDNRLFTWRQTPFRGNYIKIDESFWERYKKKQLVKLVKLLRRIMSLYKIPLEFPPLGPLNYHGDPYMLQDFRGILGHSAIDDTKMDPGPHFDFYWLKTELML